MKIGSDSSRTAERSAWHHVRDLHPLSAILGKMRVTLRTLCLCRLCAAGLWVSACTGAPHQLFEPNAGPPVADVRPIPGAVDAGSKTPDSAAVPKPRDAGPDGAVAVSPKPDPDLDPMVQFVWTETVPGQGTCKAGTYVGSFTCTSADGKVVTGQVLITLAGSPEEQRLKVSAGAVKDLTGALFNSGMSGMLDCQTRHFSGLTVNGTSPFGPFAATLEADYNDRDLSIEGKLVMQNAAKETCDGTFRVSATL